MIEWHQWIDTCGRGLMVVGAEVGHEPMNVNSGKMLVAQWQEREWVDITSAMLPVIHCPNEMETIAFWTCIPEPDPALLEQLKYTV